ncbi:MAG: glycosyltransferase [Deltaproteobacteria bacterium]|nr:glycosyltransferase [Deltaproteobacteria bacterium]
MNSKKKRVWCILGIVKTAGFNFQVLAMLIAGPHISQKAVLLIAPQPFFLQRGTPINVRAMAAALAKVGYEVDLLVFPLGNDVQTDGVRVHRSWGVPGIRSVPIGPSWRKLVLDLFLFLKAVSLVLRKRYAAVQGIEEGGFMAWFLGTLTRTPSIFDMDSCMVSQLESSGFVRSNFLLRWLSSIEMFCIKRSSAVITVCQALTEKVRAFAPNSRIYQIEDFPLEGLETRDPTLLDALRAKFNLTGKKNILYTGNFESYQGLDLLLEAFASVALRLRDLPAPTQLVLVGGDSEQIARYKKKARDLQIDAQVVFTGMRPAEEMGAFMEIADVLASPRLHGSNTPLKLYSYMAMGKAIVATDIASHTQVLTVDSAFLAAPRAHEYGAALAEALESSASQTRALRAKELVETKYSKKCFEEKLTALYSELVGPPVIGVTP